MTAANMHRFLVVCALASDLYCPGYNPRQSLAKDSNLARTALRYKVDTAKLAIAAREEISNKRKGNRTNPSASNRQAKAKVESCKALPVKRQK
jgi:hypothetical protein